MFTSIKNKVAVITGASKGIGKGIALKFAEKGAKVLIVSRYSNTGEAVAQDIQSRGLKAYHIEADVSSESDMNAVANYALKHLGSIDIICANAGIYPDNKIADMSVKEWDNVFNVNLKGMFITIKSLLPVLKNAEYGRIIITSSITGPITGYPGWSHYGATKAGQLGFMRTAAIELAQHGITINAVLPGNIYTEGLSDLGDEYLEKMASAIPLKKLGSIDDVANLVLFLSLKESGYITGQSIVVDGGQILPESLDALS